MGSSRAARRFSELAQSSWEQASRSAQAIKATSRRSITTCQPQPPREDKSANMQVNQRRWIPAVEHTTRLIQETLQNAPQHLPSRLPVEPDAPLPLDNLRDPRRKASIAVTPGRPAQLRAFVQDQALRFDEALCIEHVNGEDMVEVPRKIVDTSANRRQPLAHFMVSKEMNSYIAHGLDANQEGVVLQGSSYLKLTRPLERTQDGGTTGWTGQLPYFLQEPGDFPGQELMHGILPPGVTGVLFHASGAQVAPSSSFMAAKFDPEAGRQWCLIHSDLLKLDPALQARLRQSGALDADWVRRLQEFLCTHDTIPGREFDRLTDADLAASSALIVHTQTLPPTSAGAEGHTLMSQTVAVSHPEQYEGFMPWSPAPALVERPRLRVITVAPVAYASRVARAMSA